jgi:hypothetical protein
VLLFVDLFWDNPLPKWDIFQSLFYKAETVESSRKSRKIAGPSPTFQGARPQLHGRAVGAPERPVFGIPVPSARPVSEAPMLCGNTSRGRCVFGVGFRRPKSRAQVTHDKPFAA